MEKVQERMTSQVIAIFSEEWNKSDRDLHIAMTQTFRYIEENSQFFQYFLKNADLKVIFSSGQVRELLGPALSDEEMMYLTFYIGGINALLLYWLERGCPESPADLIRAMEYSRNSAYPGSFMRTVRTTG